MRLWFFPFVKRDHSVRPATTKFEYKGGFPNHRTYSQCPIKFLFVSVSKCFLYIPKIAQILMPRKSSEFAHICFPFNRTRFINCTGRAVGSGSIELRCLSRSVFRRRIKLNVPSHCFHGGCQLKCRIIPKTLWSSVA